MNKDVLDSIIEEHKAQPVGSGYIDIIVRRENYQNFIQSLVENGFIIRSISWWEWCEKEEDCDYGLGGPDSDYFNGRFAEIPAEVDDLKLDDLNFTESIDEVKKLIENKSIEFSVETIQFKDSTWLTPAFWLDVPSDWKNLKSV